MMAIALPLALLCAALGLALAFASVRTAMLALGVLAVVAAAVSFAPLAPSSQERLLLGLWITAVATALTVYLPRAFGRAGMLVLAANAGLWAGAVAATGAKRDLATALLAALLFVPGGVIVRRGWGIAVKVAASWVIAISVLAAVVSLTPTPGYKPDHMD